MRRIGRQFVQTVKKLPPPPYDAEALDDVEQRRDGDVHRVRTADGVAAKKRSFGSRALAAAGRLSLRSRVDRDSRLCRRASCAGRRHAREASAAATHEASRKLEPHRGRRRARCERQVKNRGADCVAARHRGPAGDQLSNDVAHVAQGGQAGRGRGAAVDGAEAELPRLAQPLLAQSRLTGPALAQAGHTSAGQSDAARARARCDARGAPLQRHRAIRAGLRRAGGPRSRPRRRRPRRGWIRGGDAQRHVRRRAQRAGSHSRELCSS